MKPISWLSLLLISIFVLGGCTPANSSIQPTKDMQYSSSTSLPETVIGTPISTQKPAVNETPSYTATQTPIATLEPEQVKETMEPLLQEPMNCAEPCFWGIVPMKTHLDDTKTFFSRLGFDPFEGINPDTGKYFYTIEYVSDSDSIKKTNVTIHASNNLIADMNISMQITNQDGSHKEWSAFSPETLIKRYGKPSHVEFAVGPQQSVSISMVMYFDSSFLIVWYSGYDMNPESFCPMTAPFDFVRLWLGPNPPNPPTFAAIPLEKTTSLTMDQFTQLMLGDPNKACFAVK